MLYSDEVTGPRTREEQEGGVLIWKGEIWEFVIDGAYFVILQLFIFSDKQMMKTAEVMRRGGFDIGGSKQTGDKSGFGQHNSNDCRDE